MKKKANVQKTFVLWDVQEGGADNLIMTNSVKKYQLDHLLKARLLFKLINSGVLSNYVFHDCRF